MNWFLKHLDWYEVKTPLKYLVCKIVTEISHDNYEATACGTKTGDTPTVQSGQE